jgi:hypothetical protein
MRARLTGFAVALFASVAAAGIAGAQSSYPCTQTNDNLPNPYRLVANVDAGQCRRSRSEKQPLGRGPL